ncbi:MAG: response regulator [Chloroflexaceae bacterium]|jgi:CheY-like chemotaxis protein|nr:response regulator [Chloroflexaceae bacterium]
MSSQFTRERVTRILLVEDDRHISRILEMSMPELGLPHEVISVLSAEEGLEQWRAQPFDLLVSDYNLRGMTGLKLMSVLKEQGVTAPMVLVTAYGNPQIAHEAHTLQVDAFIAKPFFIDELINTLRNLIIASRDDQSRAVA